MDHGNPHAGHGGMDHGDMGGTHKCNMNMLFTWDTTDLCIVFRSWHVSNTFTLLLYLILVVLLCAGYEAVRELSRRYEATVVRRVEASPNNVSISVDDDPEEPITGAPTSAAYARIPSLPRWLTGSQRQRSETVGDLVRSALYGLQVFYSFFIMLLFMTYNGWVMLAVALGAFIGHWAFGLKTSSTKSVACH